MAESAAAPERFAERAHWTQFYSRKPESAPFEWFVSAAQAVDALLPLLPPKGKLLHAGCGTSDLGPQLASHGFEVDNVDFEPACIAAAQARGDATARCRWHVESLERLPAAWTGRFDAVVDKGGLCAVVFGGDSAAHAVLHELRRCCKPGGSMHFITADAPEERLELMQHGLGGGARLTYRAIEPEDDEERQCDYFVYSVLDV